MLVMDCMTTVMIQKTGRGVVDISAQDIDIGMTLAPMENLAHWLNTTRNIKW